MLLRLPFETNYIGVARMTATVPPGMRERRAGPSSSPPPPSSAAA
jgi:hypothetical protein